MQRLLDNLRTIPGVTGACIHHSANGVRFNNLPEQFKPQQLNEIGGQLIKICSAGRLSFPDLGEFVIAYAEALLLCHPLSAHDCLIVVCEPTINLSLLTLSLNLALADLPPDALTTSSPAAITPPSAMPTAPVENLRESGPLAKPLQGMASQLAKILGPMAFIVFDEAVAAWQVSQTPTPAGLSKLLDTLCREIGDAEKAKQYRELVRKHLGPASG
jgi:hypothetical protein